MPIAHPRSLGSRSQNTESLLQHFYFIVAVVIVLALVILRIIVLRRRNQALSNFFRMGSSSSQYAYGSYPPYGDNFGSMYHGIQLAPPRPVYRQDRRTRAADIDEQGRRLGSGGDEVDGLKDVLPAYDNLERLPKYVEAGWSHAAPLPPAEQSTASRSPEEQSGTARINTTYGVLRENTDPLGDDTRAVSGVINGSDGPSLTRVHTDASRG